MPWITPKINWTSADGVGNADMNRIEGNIEQLATDTTATAILNKLKTVDGAGSGLDADLLDGIDSARIMRGMGDIAYNAQPPRNSMYRVVSDGAGNLYPGAFGVGVSMHSGTGGGEYVLHLYKVGSNLFMQQTGDGSAITRAGWVKVWTEGNDGHGSGLDADLVKGMDLTQQTLHWHAVGLSINMAWRRFGDGHVIVDNSGSNYPGGNTNSQFAWEPTYPSLMAFNGTNTFGVRVDSARVADRAVNADSVNAGIQFFKDNGYLQYWDPNTQQWKAAGGLYRVQRGSTLVDGGGNANVTIAGVNMSKTHLNLLSHPRDGRIVIELTSPTNIRMYNQDNSNPVVWECIEFY